MGENHLLKLHDEDNHSWLHSEIKKNNSIFFIGLNLEILS